MEACGLAGHLIRVLMQTWDPLTGNMSPEELERERDESGADGPTGTSFLTIEIRTLNNLRKILTLKDVHNSPQVACRSVSCPNVVLTLTMNVQR